MEMKPYEIRALIEASKVINRHFGIRVTEGRTSRLCSLTRLALVLDDVKRALLLAAKAMKDQRQNPTFRAKGRTIVFFWR